MKTMSRLDATIKDWPLPAGVRAASTTRAGGVSTGPWSSLNLGLHVGDNPERVALNRARLRQALALPSEPVWLDQVHGARVVELCGGEQRVEADASFTRQAGVVCVVMTADCLPVLFTDLDGRAVAAAHAGWRGLAAGVLEATVACFDHPARVSAWLGPAIEPGAFQVGDEVREAFVAGDPGAVVAFEADDEGRWSMDIYRLARRRLQRAGVGRIHGGGRATHGEPEQYFSYRRDGITGRMASLVWINEECADE